MKYAYIIFLICFIGNSLISQNLVPNGGFEEYDDFPEDFAQWHKCKMWNNAFGMATPDYCMSDKFIPNDYIKPFAGKGFMGIVTSQFNSMPYLEYISVQLSKHLVKGQKYNVSFWALADSNMQYICPNLQLAFTREPLRQFEASKISSPYQYEIPDVTNNNTWKEYSFVFKPNFDCYYLTFGNFNGSNDDKNCINNKQNEYSISYFYIDEVTVSETFDIMGDTILCEGETKYLSASGCNQCMWIDAKNRAEVLSYSSMVQITPNVQTTYIAKDLTNFKSNSITVKVKPRPKADLGSDLYLCHGETATISVKDSKSTIKWQNGSSERLYTTQKAGSYIVELSLDDCINSDTIVVNRKDGCDFGIELPNIFTPNNDGKNDLFMPLKQVGIASLNIKVHNRWGAEVFSTSDLDFGWNGKDADDGIYFWSLEYNDYDDNTYKKKGTIELRR